MSKQRLRETVIDFLLSRRIDHSADYIQRGCRFAPLSDGDLVAKWFASFKSMADTPLEPSGLAEHDDIEAEMELRNIEPPYDRCPDFERFMAATDVELQAIRRDPERLGEMMDRLVADLRAFEEARDNAN